MDLYKAADDKELEAAGVGVARQDGQGLGRGQRRVSAEARHRPFTSDLVF
ncbi:hypothetical protein PMIN02_012905 [Paraphaeosphaeria minitans]